MAKIIVICAEKGGTGKSTSAAAITTGFMLAGKKTLLIDCDIQGNVTDTFKADRSKLSVMDMLEGRTTADKVMQKTDQGYICPSSRTLATADMELFFPDGKALSPEERKLIPYRLKKSLEPVQKLFDYIIIDTPPTLGVITTNALTCADSVIVPAEAEQYSLDGLGQLNKTINAVRQTTNKSLKIGGILITRYSSRTILSRQLLEVMYKAAKKLDTRVYPRPIRECISVKEAHSMKQDIFRYAPKSNAAADYKELLKEILKE